MTGVFKIVPLQNTRLTYEIFKENGYFIAYCKQLDLVTQGKTFEIAKRRMAELIPVFLQDLKERGTLEEVLLELGWRKVVRKWVVPVKVGEAISEVKIPCPA